MVHIDTHFYLVGNRCVMIEDRNDKKKLSILFVLGTERHALTSAPRACDDGLYS